MKLVHYVHDHEAAIGVLDVERELISPLVGPDGVKLSPDDIDHVLETSMSRSERERLRTRPHKVPLDTVTLHAPVNPVGRNVFCVGKNYVEHSDEFARSGYDATSPSESDDPEVPIVFTKPRSSVIGPEAEVNPHVDLTQALDYEAELTVVIGRAGSDISPDDAWDHVWGLTLANDITARDLQQRHKQWFLGKSLDTFLPMGPWLASMDEHNLESLMLEGRVNGELRQHASIKDLIFDIPTIIATLSAGMELKPGDVIATGTPAGVGLGFQPPKFLKPGDEMTVTATGLGTLRNIVAHPVSARRDHDDDEHSCPDVPTG